MGKFIITAAALATGSGSTGADKKAIVKTPNYTEEQAAKIKADYLASPTKNTVEALAVALGRNTRSIVAKLVRLGIYVAPSREAKKGGVTKDDLATSIGTVLRLSANDADSLTKANGVALRAIWTALAASKPIEGMEAVAYSTTDESVVLGGSRADDLNEPNKAD